MTPPDHVDRELFSLLYWDLRRLAQNMMRSENEAHTLQPTALVHEAYLRLADSGGLRYWQDRGRFVALASQVMEHILVEHARAKNAIKRGGKLARVELEDVVTSDGEDSSDVRALREAIDRLEQLDSRKARLVKLRYFAGMTVAEAALEMGVSPATASKDWAFARSWLKVELE